MAGHDARLGAHEVVVAHADSSAAIGAGPMLTREAREERDTMVLASGATPASGAGNRNVARAGRPVPHVFRARP